MPIQLYRWRLKLPKGDKMEAPVYDFIMGELIDSFVKVAQEVVDEHAAAHFPNNPRHILTVKRGRKYAKLIRTDEDGSHRSVHCFVNMENGDILKAATWAAPAKHARGNVADADGGRSAVGPYGANYIR